MKYALMLLLAVTLQAQTAFPTRVDITSNSAQTVGGELRVYNSTNASYGSVNYDRIVFPGLTGLYDGTSGLQVWRSGLIGARATLIPGGVAGSGQLTLCDQTIAYCTGFKASTSSTGSTIYSLPPADGSAGYVLTTDGAGTLSWGAAGGGSAPPFVDTTNIIKGSADATKLLRFEVDGLTTATTRTWTAQDANITVAGIDLAQTWTATQTMRDVKPSVDDTYKLGESATPLRWYELNANRLNGICTTLFTCSQSNNYLNTRKLNLYDMGGGTNSAWDIRTNANSPVTSYLEMRDEAGTAFLTLSRQAASVTLNNGILDGNWIPSADLGYDQGSQSVRWKRGEFQQVFTRAGASGSGSSTAYCSMQASSVSCTNASATTFSANRSTGQILSAALAGFGVRCLESDNSGNINLSAGSCLTNPTTTTGDMIYRNSGGSLARLAIGSAGDVLSVSGGIPAWLTLSGTSPISYSAGVISCSTCVTTSRSVSTTSPLGGGGALSSNLTLTCTTCVTTAGGQSISGTTTVSTLSVSSDISGTFNLSGNQTVTGNWYNRTFSGGDANCATGGPGGTAVADGWQGVRTDTGGASGKPQVEICIGAAMKYIALN